MTYDFLIRRVDGEDMDGEFSSFGCSDPNDWTPADDYDHDDPTVYEICRVVPIKRRTFGLGHFCWNCQGEGEIEHPCPVDTDGDGDCAACSKRPDAHNTSCTVCSGTGDGEDSTEPVDVPQPDEVRHVEEAFCGALVGVLDIDKVGEVLDLYRKIRDGKQPLPDGWFSSPTAPGGN